MVDILSMARKEEVNPFRPPPDGVFSCLQFLVIKLIFSYFLHRL